MLRTMMRDYLDFKDTTQVLNSKQFVVRFRGETYKEEVKAAADMWHDKYRKYKEEKAKKEGKDKDELNFEYPHKKVFMWAVIWDKVKDMLEERSRA